MRDDLYRLLPAFGDGSVCVFRLLSISGEPGFGHRRRNVLRVFLIAVIEGGSEDLGRGLDILSTETHHGG